VWPSPAGDAHPPGSQVTRSGGALVAHRNAPSVRRNRGGGGEGWKCIKSRSGMIRRVVHPLAGLWAARRATTGHLVDVSIPTRALWLKAVSFHRGVLKPLVARTSWGPPTPVSRPASRQLGRRQKFHCDTQIVSDCSADAAKKAYDFACPLRRDAGP